MYNSLDFVELLYIIIVINIEGEILMELNYCPGCGNKLNRITTKTVKYKAVCLDCELTYKLMQETERGEVIKLKASSPSQMTEAVMNKNSKDV